MSETADLYRQGLACLTRGDLDGYLDLFSEDILFEFPFAPPARPPRVRGRNQLRAYLEPILSLGTLENVRHLAIYETDVEGTVVVEMTVDLRPAGSEVLLARRYIAVVTAAAGRITSYRDYWNPQWTGDAVESDDAP